MKKEINFPELIKDIAFECFIAGKDNLPDRLFKEHFERSWKQTTRRTKKNGKKTGTN
jgi:hypothetical protein